jgi:hypothetical protein
MLSKDLIDRIGIIPSYTVHCFCYTHVHAYTHTYTRATTVGTWVLTWPKGRSGLSLPVHNENNKNNKMEYEKKNCARAPVIIACERRLHAYMTDDPFRFLLFVISPRTIFKNGFALELSIIHRFKNDP